MNEWMNDWMAEWKTEVMKEWCLSCLPAISAVASATQWFSSRSCYNAFSNLQLQSRIAAAWHYHSCYAARSRANANPHSRRAAPNRPKFVHQQRTFPSCSEHASFLDFYMESRSRFSLVHIFPIWSSKRASILKSWTANWALAIVRSTRGTAETDIPLQRPRKPLYPFQKTQFSAS
jgi:hypothetical protein